MSATVFYSSAQELATVANVFKVLGAATDPTAVVLTITDPAGFVTTYNWPGGPNTLTHVATGSFKQDVPSPLDGIWAYLWTGTPPASDAVAGTWTVFPTSLNRYYCTAEELKSRLQISTTSDDSEIALAVAAASRAVDGYCGRYFWRGTDTRTYVPRDLYQTRTDDLVSVSALATDPAGNTAQGGTFPVSWPAGSFQLLPYNPGTFGEPWPFTKVRAVGGFTFPWVVPLLLMRMDRVQVTGVFGWPAVPAVIRSMTLTVAAEVFRSKDAPGGGGAPGEFAVAVISASPMVRQALEVYRRNPFLAA